MQQMFSLPDTLCQPGVGFEAVIRYLAERGEYGEVPDLDDFVRIRVELARAFEPHYMERTRANGRVISVEGAPLPEGGWVTVYTDITRIKDQEKLLRSRSEELSDQVLRRSEELAATNRAMAATNAALEEAKHQLTRMEERTRLTTQMMPAHIAHIGTDRRYTFSNQRLRNVMAVGPDEIVGMHARDALGAEAYSAIAPHLDRAYAGTPSVFEFSHSPSSRRIRVAFTPDVTDTGAVQGVYVLSMDVTEETQSRVALQQTRRREMAAQLTSGLAHDFSNLLTIILGMQGKLERMEDLPAGARDLIAATLSAARRGGDLLERMSDATSPRTLHPTPTSVTEILNDLGVMAQPALSSSHKLNIETYAGTQTFQIDAGMVRDSLLNLILNARDAMPGGGQITVTARTVQDTWLELCVADTGPGFSAAALVYAFDPFYTTKGDDGTGLGLAMVYDMTKLSGGDVRLHNDGGAHVVIRLPLRHASQPIPPCLVLLVEDTESLREQFRDMLMEQGHMVLEATSVHEAEMLLDTVPDIARVLSDIKLAGTRTGLDLRALTSRPVTLMTSLPPSDPLHKSAARGGPVLQKPFTAAELERGLLDAGQPCEAPA